MKIRSITIKNFLSVGNQVQAINFENNDLTLVLGENLDLGGDDAGQRNGVGKSLILSAVSYALYGQSLNGIKKDNLINFINNRNMIVSLCFEKDGVEYQIDRGRKPGILKFYINGTEQEDDNAQGDSRETQRDLTDLLGMSHDMFKHIIALNTYTEPFLLMRAADQRMIIEQLLGITQLSSKADALKDQIKIIKEQIVQENANIEAIKLANQRIQQSIDSLINKQTVWQRSNNSSIEKLANEIVKLESLDIDQELKNHELLKQYNQSIMVHAELISERSQKTKQSSLIQRQINDLIKNIESLSNAICPVCNQEFHDNEHILENYKQQLIELNSEHAQVQQQLGLINNEIDQLSTINPKPIVYYQELELALKHQSNYANLLDRLERTSAELDPYQEQIDELKTQAIQEIKWERINQLTQDLEHHEFLLKLLTNKDSFIRKKIINQNLSYLNNRLTHYLDQMGLPHKVTFENDLSVTITQLGRELDLHNLSRGEMNRVIIATSFAFKDVWENLYGSVNLLFIDELLDNGLDSAGVENALKIIKHLVRDKGKTVYLISHKDELVSRVNNVLKVVKSNGFTMFENVLEK